MTTGRIRTAGAGETLTRGMKQTQTGDLRKKKNTKTPKKTTLRTGTSVLTPESYENATPDLLASQEEPNPSTTGKQEIQKHTGQ